MGHGEMDCAEMDVEEVRSDDGYYLGSLRAGDRRSVATEAMSIEGPPQAPPKGETTPLLRMRQRLVAYAKEPMILFVGAWSMMVGWSAGDVIIVVMREHFDNFHSWLHNPVGFATLVTIISTALVLSATLWGTSSIRMVRVFLLLFSHALGVMLGRSWNEVMRMGIKGVLLWQAVEAVTVTVAAILFSRWQFHKGRKMECFIGLVNKVLSMLVGWGWADTSKAVFKELITNSAIASTVIYAVVVTIVASVVMVVFEYISPLAITVFGISVGFAWQQAFNQIMRKESWAPAGDMDTIAEVAWLALFAVVLTLGLALVTCWLRGKADRALEQATAKRTEAPLRAGGQAMLLANLLSLVVLAASINVGWGWGDCWVALYKMVVPGDFGSTLLGVVSYFFIVLLCSVLVLWLYAKNSDDQALGAEGGGDAAVGD